MTAAGQRLIAAAKEARAMVQDMTAPDYPRCEVCGQHPVVIRKAGSPLVDLFHRSERACHITLSGFPEEHIRAAWRRHSQE